jgi:hypothetical protein
MNSELNRIKEIAYDKCSFIISDLIIEPEGKEYKACNFKLNELKVICRNAKITPKKIGQFVTFWKRNKNGVPEPYHETDKFDFYVVTVLKENRVGQFILPKSVLIEREIISSNQKDGKRGFRIYPSWDTPTSKQAKKTQEWQTNYFIEFGYKVDLNFVKRLYLTK